MDANHATGAFQDQLTAFGCHALFAFPVKRHF
jgi:hypothetical protein